MRCLPMVCGTHTMGTVPAMKTPTMPTVEKMTIALTPEMAGFVRHEVGRGAYASTSEAIREAVMTSSPGCGIWCAETISFSID